MKDLVVSAQCKKDLKRVMKQGIDLTVFYETVNLLQNDMQLPEKRKDHQLTGKLRLYRECHLAPNLLLLYRISADAVNVARIGSHSELLGI